MLEIINVSKNFDDNQVLKNISFDVREGEIQAILGKNGAGKTTLFRIILGIMNPNEGEVLYNGKKITQNDFRYLGFLPEERSLLKKYTIKQQLEFFARLKKVSKEDVEPRIDYWLKRFKLSEYKHRKMKELSKGNQQKIQFISAILHEPKVVILDEPFSGLDPFNIELFRDVILELKDKGSAILFSSHRLDYIESFSEEIIVLVDGVDKINGNIKEIKKQQDEFNLRIVSDVDVSKIEQIENVISVTVEASEILVRFKDYDTVNEISKVVQTSNFEKFNVELLSLEDIIKKDAQGGLDE